MVIRITRNVIVDADSWWSAGQYAAVRVVDEAGGLVTVEAGGGEVNTLPGETFERVETVPWEGPVPARCQTCGGRLEDAFWAGTVGGRAGLACNLCWAARGKPGTGHRWELDPETGGFVRTAPL